MVEYRAETIGRFSEMIRNFQAAPNLADPLAGAAAEEQPAEHLGVVNLQVSLAGELPTLGFR